MKTQYTRGPWIVDEYIIVNGVAYIGVCIPNSEEVIALTGFKFAGDQESSKANAVLIAAVHDLLIALKDIEQWKSHSIDFAVDYGSNGVRDFYREIARSAIAKATGEQNADHNS